MKIKRFYKGVEGERVIDYIKIIQYSSHQNFTQKFLNNGVRDSYVTISKGFIVLHANPDDLRYKIIRVPGLYCCHDDKTMDNEVSARNYVKSNFLDVESPDIINPSGYRQDNFFRCELENK